MEAYPGKESYVEPHIHQGSRAVLEFQRQFWGPPPIYKDVLKEYRTPEEYVGHWMNDLPSPALVIRKEILEANCKAWLVAVQENSASFRADLKVLKTTPITKMMLGGGKHKAVMVSSISEIYGIMPLLKEGLIDDVLWGVPFGGSPIAAFKRLAEQVKLTVVVDHEIHLETLNQIALESEANQMRRWPVLVRVDRGAPAIDRLNQLLEFLAENEGLELCGFYCEATELYGPLQPPDTPESLIKQQMESVMAAAQLVGDHTSLILSIEATTSDDLAYHLSRPLPSLWKLEYRSGSFAVNDLQRVSRSLATTDDIAMSVLAKECSTYGDRREVLIDAGAVALSRETSEKFPGFGTVADRQPWYVGRLTQEQGILVTDDNGPHSPFPPSAVSLLVQNAGVTAGAYDCYYVVGGRRDTVLEVWHRWSEW
ncbi:MAG: hypothetical protein M1830_004257 [Pleopsidium flavum]|nr:MAG: hypothetical protein M1830_004257 [Pleopsidium flavum]